MNRFTPIDYSAFIPEKFDLIPNGELHHYLPVDIGWGRLQTSAMTLPDISVVMFNSSLGMDIQLSRKAGRESTTIDTCVFLDGHLESDFAGLDKRMSMQKGMQNFIYQPNTVADHWIPSQQQLRVLHFMVDKTYYTNLLSDHEKWSAELKEDILSRKLIYGLTHNTRISPRMMAIINDVLNCPLSGSLRSIVLEAKVLEFLALQLDSLVKERGHVNKDEMRSNDKDKLFALKEHLQQNFSHEHSLRSLGREFAINEFKLKKGFKSLFGTTVFEFIHDLKMDHARNLLLSGQVYINEVSGMVGYKNPNHFSTAFKKKFGVNPAKFKS